MFFHFQYSSTLNKLFVDIDKYVQVAFSMSAYPQNVPDDFTVRLVPVFGVPQSFAEPVKRCPNHASPSDASNKGFPEVTKR